MGPLLFFLDTTIEAFIITDYDPLIPLFRLLQKKKRYKERRGDRI